MFRKKSSTRQRRSVASSRETQPVFSYYSRRLDNPEKGGKGSQRETKQGSGSRPWWHYVPSVLAIAAIALSLIYILGLSTNPKILQANGKITLLRPITVYQQAAQKDFESSILNRSKLTVNTAAITAQLQSQFPELTNISIALPLIGRRPVYIVPNPPVLILKTGANSFVIDGQGRAIMTLDQLATVSNQHLPTVTDQSGLAIKTGQAAVPASYINFISVILQQLAAKKLTVDSLVLPARSFELDVHISGQAYSIKMNLQNDPTEQVGTYLAAQQKLAQANQTPASYFDVRVPGRVYYK